jgi:Polyketide cyclase / dehydrase and lipid transport
MRFEIDTSLDQEEAFARAADFGRLEEWDPAVEESRLVEGAPLSVGAVYQLKAPRWLGQVVLAYRVVSIDPPGSVIYQGGSRRVTSTDRISVVPTGVRSRVVIESEIEMAGRGRWALPAIRGMLWVAGRSLSLPALRRRLAA